MRAPNPPRLRPAFLGAFTAASLGLLAPAQVLADCALPDDGTPVRIAVRSCTAIQSDRDPEVRAHAHLEPLALVQLCCERLRGLPQRIGERRPLLESGGGILLSAEDLELRLAREQEALRRERSGTLRRERQRLVDQLSRNLDAARFGMDAREARLLALATRLEQIEGGLRQLQQQVDQQWPSSEASGAAVAEAIAPLDEALDQIERLLDAGRDPQTP
jgi:hypothetical protein